MVGSSHFGDRPADTAPISHEGPASPTGRTKVRCSPGAVDAILPEESEVLLVACDESPDGPFTAELMYSGHVMRHTLGTIVERLRGAAVAEAMLGHGPRRPTNHYTLAGVDETASALSAITGVAHPLEDSAGSGFASTE